MPVGKIHKHVKKAHPEKLPEFTAGQAPAKQDNDSQGKVQAKAKAKTKAKKGPWVPPKKHLKPSPEAPSKSQNNEVSPELVFLYCPKCRAKVRKDLYEDHCKRKHLTADRNKAKARDFSGKRRLVRESTNSSNVEKKSAETAPSPVTKKRKSGIKDIRLENRDGYRYSDPRVCTACGIQAKPTWRFMATNGKDVFVCSRCKPVILERSFGKKDALDYAVSGGMFEGNRRRH